MDGDPGAADDERARRAAIVEEGMRQYIEYHNIVGDADGGVPLTEEQYKVFKQRALEARLHRLYVSWRSRVTGIDCHLIGPATRCFCTHSYKSHATDDWQERKIKCKVKGCKCQGYEYIPVHGTFRIKCRCKHFFDEHNVRGTHACLRDGCACTAFYSPMSCSCGEKWEAHYTAIESREERQAAGRPVDNLCGGGEGYEALGGITGFSSLVDGIERQDLSGIGRLSPEAEQRPIGRVRSVAAQSEPQVVKSRTSVCGVEHVPKQQQQQQQQKRQWRPTSKLDALAEISPRYADRAQQLMEQESPTSARSRPPAVRSQQQQDATPRSAQRQQLQEDEIRRMLEQPGLSEPERAVLRKKLALAIATRVRRQGRSSSAEQ
eukprot:m51a1_g9148 hypothetical protein (377) ;mRNA; f:94456-96109